MTTAPDPRDPPLIVVGIDGSPHSEQALRWALHLAGLMGARVEAVSVWEVLPEYGLAAPATDWDPEAEARAQLNDTIARVVGQSVPDALRRSLRRGNTAQQLIEAGTGAAMIVVGSRGRGGFVGLLLGSVSRAVAAHAGCPVLVIHTADAPPALS